MTTKATPAAQATGDAHGRTGVGGPIQTATDLRDRIRVFAAAEPDPGRVTQQVLNSLLTRDEQRLILELTLRTHVSLEMAWLEAGVS